MIRRLASSSLVALSLALVACGSDPASPTGSGSGGGDTTGTAGTGGGTGGGETGIEGAKTLVVIGDSISDGGGVGPFFDELLFQNDDAKYPEWKGKDLKTRYAGLKVVHAAVGGSQSKDLHAQVMGLPASLEGPVVVTITIGGNDMQANIIKILQGTDGPARDAFRANIADALGALTMPDHFGKAVAVHVFEADIYDPTDGTGDFSSCPSPLNLVPKQPSDVFFGNWNAVATDEIPKHGMSLVEPLHDTFHGHGVVSPEDEWFAGDCIHPNAKGHDELRRMFWKAITGDAGP